MRNALAVFVLFLSFTVGAQDQSGPFGRMDPDFTLSADGPGKITITVEKAASRVPLKLCLLDRPTLEKVLQGLSDAHQVNVKQPCVPLTNGRASISESIGRAEWGKVLSIGVSLRIRKDGVSRDSLEQSAVISLDGKGFLKPVTTEQERAYLTKRLAI